MHRSDTGVETPVIPPEITAKTQLPRMQIVVY